MTLLTAPSFSTTRATFITAIPTQEQRRAALVGLWPNLGPVLTALTAHPRAICKVPAVWLEVVLTCVPTEVASTLWDVDPRCTLQAALRLLGVPRPTTPGSGSVQESPTADPSEADSVEIEAPTPLFDLTGLEHWELTEVRAALNGAVENVASFANAVEALKGEWLDRRKRLMALAAEEVMTNESSRPEATTLGLRWFHELIQGQHGYISHTSRNIMDAAFGSSNKLNLFSGCPPLNLHAVKLLAAATCNTQRWQDLARTASFDPEVVTTLHQNGASWLWSIWACRGKGLLLLEMILGDEAATLTDLEGADIGVSEFLDLIRLCANVPLRARLIELFRDGSWGRLEYPGDLPSARNLGLTEIEIIRMCDPRAAGKWLTTADLDQVKVWLPTADVQVAMYCLNYVEEEPRAAKLATLIATMVPGLGPQTLGARSDDLQINPLLHIAIAEVIAAGLDKNPELWPQLWALIETFPGSVSDAIDVVRACRI